MSICTRMEIMDEVEPVTREEAAKTKVTKLYKCIKVCHGGCMYDPCLYIKHTLEFIQMSIRQGKTRMTIVYIWLL